MKKIVLTFTALTLFIIVTNAQDTLWRKSGIINLNFNQTSFNNWAAGGENALSLSGLLSAFDNYKKGKTAWDNSLDLGYGLLKQGDQKVRKNEDKIDFTSKLGHDANGKGKLFYTALLNFKSQFDKGYNYPNDSIAISKFAAPAYITIALGLDYKPNKDFSVFVSPLTAKITLVTDQDLADAGAYGVDPAEYNSPGVKTKAGKQSRIEPGAYVNAKFQKDIMQNVNLLTKLDLFSNYTDNPQNVDVNWELLLAMKINKLLTASISTQLIYDDDTPVPIFKKENEIKIPVGVGPRTQFKEVLAIGLAYKFL